MPTLDTSYSFTIEDLTKPLLLSAKTRGLTRLRVRFNEPVLQGTGELGDALYVRDISGGVQVKPAENLLPARVTTNAPTFTPADVGLYLGIAGAENALNNDIFKITAYISSTAVAIDPADVIEEDLPPGTIVTVSVYRVEGVLDTRRVIPFFEPVVVGATSVSTDEVELEFHTDITQQRLYRVFGLLVEDLNENVLDEQSIEFTTEPCGAPQDRVDSEFGWLHFLPEENLNEDSTGDLERTLRILDEPTQLILCDIDHFPEILDIDLIPDHLLDALLAHLGNPFSFAPELAVADKRRLAAVLEEIYQEKGGEFAIESVVNFILNVQVDVRPYLDFHPTWDLGLSELGVDTFLGPGTLFLRYSFEVEAFVNLNETTRRRLIEIVQYMKPAHTHFVKLIEPTNPETPVDEAPLPVPP